MCKTVDTIKALRGMAFFIDLGDDADNKGNTLMKKCRPCVIYSVDEGYNDTNPRRYTVIPISSRDEAVIFSITEVLFQSSNGYSVVVADSIMSVSSYDIRNYAYTLPAWLMEKIDKAVKVHLQLEPASILDIDPSTVRDYKEYKQDTDIDKNNIVSNPAPAATVTSINKNQVINPESNVLPINGGKQHTVYYKRFNQSDLYILKNKSMKNWTVEECVSFIQAFNDFSNGEIAKIFGLKLSSIYTYKSAANRQISLAGASLINSKVASC